MPKEDYGNATALYNLFTLKEVQQRYPYMKWVDYINALLPSPLSVDENEVIVVRVPSYFDRLGELLQDTPNRVIANYMVWRVVDHSIIYLNDKLRKRKLVFDGVFTGKHTENARWKECTDITSRR